MSSQFEEILPVEERIRMWREDRNCGSIPVAKYQGQEYSLQQLVFLLSGSQRVAVTQILNKMAEDKPPIQVPRYYSWVGNSLRKGKPVEKMAEYVRGIAYVESEESDGPLDTEDLVNLRGRRKEYYYYAVKAGKYHFSPAPPTSQQGSEYWLEDVKYCLIESHWNEGMRPSRELSTLLPYPDIGTHFVDMTTYDGPKYSLWSEAHHGPIADTIVQTWAGDFTVPADGGGLMASRERQGVYGDLVTGYWTHDNVVKESIGETLSRGSEGSLQVFMYCSAFMTDQDYAKVRHPYLFVDKYPPYDRFKGAFKGNGWVSSVPFEFSKIEGTEYSNPAFTENLIRLGLVKFNSTGLHSIYAEKLGITSETGVGVSQTWKEFLQDKTRYFALVGMVPIIRQWSHPEPKFTRVIYETYNSAPSGSSSVVEDKMGGRTYFYFPTPTRNVLGGAPEVSSFPTLDLETAIDTTKSEYPYVLPWQWPHIEYVLANRGVPYLGVFVDLRRYPELFPHYYDLVDGKILPLSLVKTSIMDSSGDGYYWLGKSNVKMVSYRVYPGGLKVTRPMGSSSDPLEVLPRFHDGHVIWLEGDDIFVGLPIQGTDLVYGQHRSDISGLNIRKHGVKFDAHDRLKGVSRGGFIL